MTSAREELITGGCGRLHALAHHMLRGDRVRRWGADPGRLHHKLCPKEDFQQVVVVPTGAEAFILDAALA